MGIDDSTRGALERINRYRLLRAKHHAEFGKIFCLDLFGLMSLVTGFDIVRFDEIIIVPDGISTADFVKANYGQRGHDMILELIGGKQ